MGKQACQRMGELRAKASSDSQSLGVVPRHTKTNVDSILDTLKEAATYVPHSVNQLSFHRGFTPQQRLGW